MTPTRLLRNLRSFISFPYYKECVRGIIENQFPVFISYPVKPVARYGHGNPPHPILYDRLNAQRECFAQQLGVFHSYERDLFAIEEHGMPDSLEPYWNNGFIPALDAIALYSFLASRNPSHLVEIGSGNSTKFARRAIRDHGLRTRITSIDPEPRAQIDALADTVIRKPLEEVNLDIIKDLQPGDILFFDGSHRTFMNSDVTVFFLEVLPRVPHGTLIQIHDIFLPNDYPPRRARHYESEQYLLAAMLLGGATTIDVVLPNNFVENDTELSGTLKWFWTAKPSVHRWGSSFWLSAKPG